MNLPAYMTNPECRRWLLWQSEPQEQGKPRKIPYYVNGKGILDSPKDLGQLVSFDEAQSIVSSHRGRSGLAFALGADHNDGYWQGIDLDAIDGKPELLKLKLSLPGYVEISPSQNGLHAIGYGRKFKSLGSNKSGIEAYCMGRYFTVTGNNTDFPFSTDLIDIADFVEQYLRPLHSKSKTTDTKPLAVSEINATADKNCKLIDDLRASLRYISADDYAEWIAVGQALKGLENDGFVLWAAWSATSPKFKGDADLARWKTFTGDQTGYAAVFAKAQRYGWVNTSSKSNLMPVLKNEPELKSLSPESPDLGWTTMSIDDLYSNPSEPPRFIIDSLLPYGVVTLLAAHGGTGKSMLALQAAVCMAMGQAFMGKETMPGKVIFFSAEDATPTVRYRLECICRDKNIDPVRLAERLCIIDSTNNPSLYITQQREAIFTVGYDALRKLSTAYDADCIIIDNASDTFDANENERARVRAFIRFLTQFAREQSAAILLLAHIDKDTAKFGSGESYSGSTAWHNSVRSRLFLSLEKDTQLLSLAQQKSNFGKLASTIDMRRGNHGILYLFSIPSAKESGVIILSLIEKHYAQGTYISSAPTSRSNPYKMLKKDKDFPIITRKQLTDVLQELENNKALVCEIYETKNRKTKTRYRSARTAPSAPSIDVQVCADDTNTSPCSAPTTTGGMGEEITHTEDALT